MEIMETYLLDTNILIDIATSQKSAAYFQNLIAKPQVRLVTHVLCIAEFLTGATSYEEKFLKNWIKSQELEVCYLDSLEETYLIPEIRSKTKLPLPDSLILASVMKNQAILVTHDQSFLKKAQKMGQVLDPIL
jgi:predicted nucleic acid-binding protein